MTKGGFKLSLALSLLQMNFSVLLSKLTITFLQNSVHFMPKIVSLACFKPESLLEIKSMRYRLPASLPVLSRIHSSQLLFFNSEK